MRVASPFLQGLRNSLVNSWLPTPQITVVQLTQQLASQFLGICQDHTSYPHPRSHLSIEIFDQYLSELPLLELIKADGCHNWTDLLAQEFILFVVL